MRKFVLPVLGLLAGQAIAFYQVHPKAWLCVAGCRRSVDFIEFDVPEEAEGTCHHLYTASLFACTAVYCSRREIEIGYPTINQTFCINQGTPLPPYDFSNALPPHNFSWVSYPNDVDNNVYNDTAVPDKSFYRLAYDTQNAENTAMTFNWALAMTDVAFWALVLIVASAYQYHQARRLRRCMLRRHAVDPQCQDLETTTPQMQKPRWYLEWKLAVKFALESLRRRFNAPTLPAILIILAYALLNFVFCFLGYRYMHTSLLDWHAVQYERFIGNRCGFLILGNLPVIWFFSLRTNPLLHLTNWSFETFNFFHKWVARLSALLVIIHGICFTTGDSIQGMYIEHWTASTWYRCGIFNAVVVVAIVVLATRWFRRRAYEPFVLLHIGMAITFLVLLKEHLTVWKGQIRKDVWAFIWTCVALWAFDKMLRLASILYNALPMAGQSTMAIATFDSGAEIIRLDVSARFRHKSALRPGLHYYIYEPGQLRGYESHPFSLCSWNQTNMPISRRGSELKDSEVENQRSWTKAGNNTEKAALESTDAPTSDSEPQVVDKHTFLIRPRAGWSKRLQDKLQAATPPNLLHLTLLFEGSYGPSVPLHVHSDIIMLLGGSGISPAISHIHHLQSLPERSSQLRPTLRIIWVARTWAFVQNVLANELSILSRHQTGSSQLKIYLTGEADLGTRVDHVDIAADATLPAASCYEIHYGRPDLNASIAQAHQNCFQNLAVFCCGPSTFRDECRRIVQEVQQADGGDISLYLESFSL